MSQRQDEVLQSYLDNLLAEAPLTQPAEQPRPVSVLEAAEIDADEARKAQLQRLLHSARLRVEQIAEAEPEPGVTAVPVAEELPTDLAALYQLLQWHDNGRPLWAQQKFEALLFKVSGLTLAVPLIALGQIQPLTDELTPLFGQADWFMGLQPSSAGKIYVLNTARFVMPERYDPEFEQSARYVVSINGVPWGLAVDKVEQPITLSPEDVKWRSTRTQRPWLAGTVKAHMCALLDIPRMGKLLLDSDRNSKGINNQTRERV